MKSEVCLLEHQPETFSEINTHFFQQTPPACEKRNKQIQYYQMNLNDQTHLKIKHSNIWSSFISVNMNIYKINKIYNVHKITLNVYLHERDYSL